MSNFQFTILDNAAQAPLRASPGAAGWDLYTTESIALWSGERQKFPTGIAVAVPPGWAGLIWPRSGLAVSAGVDTLAGLVDPDYRGEVKAILINHGDEPITLPAGERVAQFLVVPCMTVAEEVGELPPTQRGENGFGSTG